MCNTKKNLFNTNQNQSDCQKGFTLVELIIAMLISGIVIISIYTAFRSQQRSYLAQEQVSEMQQNIRAGVGLMVNEIRMAGYDPEQTENYGINGTQTDVDTLQFTADLNDDGGSPGSGEIFLYELYDSDSNGNNDSLRRTPGGSAVANHIEELEFYYIMADESRTLTPANPDDIRGVEISILARAAKPDHTFSNTATYTTASGTVWGPYNDSHRRRFHTVTVQCRNMGL
ncbi:MAG: prepilin-type N-terminal cleavage/methylation domain-containing protein [Thermodesulfobacteriota bacterium]